VSDTTEQRGSGRHEHRAADRLLVRVAAHGGLWIGALALAALASAGAGLALPAVLGHAVDAVVRSGDPGPWLIWSALLVALLVGAETLDSLAAGAAIARSTAWLRHELWRHVLMLERAAASGFTPGDIATRLVGNAAEAGRVGPDLVRAGATLIPGLGGAIALALIDPWLCVTFLAGMPILGVMVSAFARDASDAAARYFEVQGTIAGRLTSAIGGARTIAAAGTVDREADRILAPLPELHRHGISMWRAQMRITAQDGLLVALLEIAVLAVAGASLARGRITPGEMLAASQYVVLATTLGSATSALGSLAQSRAAAGRAAAVFLHWPLLYGWQRLPEGRGRIELRGVTVRSGGDTVLEDLDLEIPAGALVAVVGRTGAGKSLLGALAGRLLDPDEGEVLLDGVPLPELRRGELRRAVGYGFERPVLMGETLADVIAFGAYAPPPQALVAAAGAAQADGFIRRMPDGYRTLLADAPMSGGERQRVGLARTFAHAGRVVVLDDVAASLDTVTEHHISRVLAGAMADRTRIVIAHRASTAARADFVVWLDGGGLRAAAPHDELWHDHDYRALFEPEAPHGPLRAVGAPGAVT
jgi:ATP-binding cassette subfamily B protein